MKTVSGTGSTVIFLDVFFFVLIEDVTFLSRVILTYIFFLLLSYTAYTMRIFKLFKNYKSVFKSKLRFFVHLINQNHHSFIIRVKVCEFEFVYLVFLDAQMAVTKLVKFGMDACLFN